jgi:predicted nucleic-acid-binding protein
MRSFDTHVLVRYQAADGRKQLAQAGILEMDQFRFEYDVLVRRSVEAYRLGRGNFSDYLIGEISQQHGCRDIVTFDRALKGSGGFTALV